MILVKYSNTPIKVLYFLLGVIATIDLFDSKIRLFILVMQITWLLIKIQC